jgi:hypothetical protein
MSLPEFHIRPAGRFQYPSSRPAPNHPSTRYIRLSVLNCPMLLGSLVRAPSSMMSQSLCTNAVMLTVFNFASTSPRFHHPLCLQARPIPSTSLSEASFSASSSAPVASCSFFPRFTFQMAFPTCSNPLSVQSPEASNVELTLTM